MLHMELEEKEALAEGDIQAAVFAADLPWGLENYNRLYGEKKEGDEPEIEQMEAPETEADIARMLEDARRAGAIK